MGCRNYLISMILCMACTLMALLGNSPDVKWLLISDMNVAIWLFVAWFFDYRDMKNERAALDSIAE